LEACPDVMAASSLWMQQDRKAPRYAETCVPGPAYSLV